MPSVTLIPPGRPPQRRNTSDGINPAKPLCGQTVVITCDISNTGEAEDTYNTGLKINGTTEANRPITLAGGESALVTFSINPKAGSYEIEIGNQKTFLEVAASPSLNNSPGIGLWWILIGLSIILLVAVFLLRRRLGLNRVFGTDISKDESATS